MNKTFILIGGGVAAATAANELRKLGFDGEIVLITDEPDLPYERPPLSKEWLSGDFDRTHFRINAADWYGENRVQVLLNTRVEKIDVAARQVQLSDGRRMDYDALVIATGVRAKTLPGFSGDRVHVMRTLADSQKLSKRLVSGRHLVVLGAGFLGCEVAAFAASRGMTVTVFDPGALPLGRAVNPHIGSAVFNIHREQGVNMRTGQVITQMREVADGLELTTAGGDTMHCDELLVAIGSVPNVELALDAGIEVDGGILTDEFGRTSASDIYAIGDVSSRFHAGYGRMFRVEHHDTAMRHGVNVARNLLGHEEPFVEEHFFWSHQYDYSLQSYGQAVGDCEQVVRGSVESRSFSVFALSNGRIRSIIALNRPADVMSARKVMALPHEVTGAQLADELFDLKSLLPKRVRPEKREVSV